MIPVHVFNAHFFERSTTGSKKSARVTSMQERVSQRNSRPFFNLLLTLFCTVERTRPTPTPCHHYAPTVSSVCFAASGEYSTWISTRAVRAGQESQWVGLAPKIIFRLQIRPL